MLAIADAAPQHTIAVHVEGGRGGGHHSWEELDELLLETYHELRRRDNVLLCAGGGVADPARAAELLCGTWSQRYDEPPMPIDAVLVGHGRDGLPRGRGVAGGQAGARGARTAAPSGWRAARRPAA